MRYIRAARAEAEDDPDGGARSVRGRHATLAVLGAGDVSAGAHPRREEAATRRARTSSARSPIRSAATTSTPVFADERFFAVRDLARLALGRVAHEQYRFDDARYYYYLVPRDSDRLAEALYEAATTRYEKKDYQGARELLDELKAIQSHHRYEDEAWILDSYIDLAQCKFRAPTRSCVGFIARYEPVRDAARRVAEDERAMSSLLAAARERKRRGRHRRGRRRLSAEAMRAIAALVRLDPAYGVVVQARAVLEHEASGLRLDGRLAR